MIESILIDVEGTTTALDFVTETLFRYARDRLEGFLRANVHDREIRGAIRAVRDGLGQEAATLDDIVVTLHSWMDADIKATPLKTIQGRIWREGYEEGTLRGHVYDDVPVMLQRWRGEGRRLAVFSSGSLLAQQLLFGHSVAGDLRTLFSRHFDTTTGSKTDPESYRTIARCLESSVERVLFLSDTEQELAAAEQAGMACTQVIRGGVAPNPKRRPWAGDFFAVRLGE